MALTGRANPQGILWAEFLAPIASGRSPHVRRVDLPAVPRVESLVSIDGVRSVVRFGGTTLALADIGDACGLIEAHADATLVWLAAPSDEALEKAAADVRARAPQPSEDESQVGIDFWQVSHGAYTRTRSIAAPAWEELERNYPPRVRAGLVRLRDVEFRLDGPRLILWHGPPGTGKTSAIRGLARAWRSGARVQVILDPELVFARSSTLMEVLMDEDEGALVRPGRCLMDAEFGPFTRTEAVEAFGSDLPDGDELTLAAVMAHQRGEQPVGVTAAEPQIGQYL